MQYKNLCLIRLCLLTTMLCSQAAFASNPLEPALFLLLYDKQPVLNDNVEYGSCPGPFWGASNCPANNPVSRVEPSLDVAHNGRYSWKLPAPPDPNALLDDSIHSGKLETGYAQLHAITRQGKVARYSAYFYLASGFDDFSTSTISPWHIQMQWKMMAPERDPALTTSTGEIINDRYWGPQNPKIALGFHNISYQSSLVLQVQVTVRDATPGLCELQYVQYRRDNTLGKPPIPTSMRTWIRLTTEIRFGVTDGYIKVWQGETTTDDSLAVHVAGINTLNQLVLPAYAKLDPARGPTDVGCRSAQGRDYYRSANTSFDFGIANYLSMRSYDPSVRQETSDHLLYVDDILVVGVDGP